MNQKFTSTIAGASIFISVIGLLSRGLGFVREMIFAGFFGLETEFDLYLVGAVLPITINTVILYIGQNFFVPAFQKISSLSDEDSQKYYNQALVIFFGAGIIIAAILYTFSDGIINIYMHSSSVGDKETAGQILKIFLLTIPFSAGISMLSALLQTVFEFKYPSISILFLNISIIIIIFLFTNKIGIYVIPVGYLIGTVLQCTYLLYKSKRYFKFSLIFRFQKYESLKSFVGSSLLTILLIESIGQLYSIFDRYFYGYISSGGIASLNYAQIIFSLPITVLAISLATVVFPKITKSINTSSRDDLERIYNDSISINIFIFMPISFLMIYYGDTFIKIAFERGKFLAESTTITFNALKYYSLSLVFYSVYAILNKIFYSINLAKILLIITVVGIFLKLIINFLLVEKYQQNGLAISTSISYFFFFLTSYLVLNSKLKISNKTLFIKDFFIHFTNCVICMLSVFLVSLNFTFSNSITEAFNVILFLLLYLFNLILLEFKTVKILKQVLQRFKLSLVNGTT